MCVRLSTVFPCKFQVAHAHDTLLEFSSLSLPPLSWSPPATSALQLCAYLRLGHPENPSDGWRACPPPRLVSSCAQKHQRMWRWLLPITVKKDLAVTKPHSSLPIKVNIARRQEPKPEISKPQQGSKAVPLFHTSVSRNPEGSPFLSCNLRLLVTGFQLCPKSYNH